MEKFYSEDTALHEALHYVMNEYYFGKGGEITLANLVTHDDLTPKGQNKSKHSIRDLRTVEYLYVLLSGNYFVYLENDYIEQLFEAIAEKSIDPLEYNYDSEFSDKRDFKSYQYQTARNIDNSRNYIAYLLYSLENDYNGDISKSIDLIRELYSLYDYSLIALKIEQIYDDIDRIIRENELMPKVVNIAIEALNKSYGENKIQSIDLEQYGWYETD
jgi:hypothetical protein